LRGVPRIAPDFGIFARQFSVSKIDIWDNELPRRCDA